MAGISATSGTGGDVQAGAVCSSLSVVLCVAFVSLPEN